MPFLVRKSAISKRGFRLLSSVPLRFVRPLPGTRMAEGNGPPDLGNVKVPWILILEDMLLKVISSVM
jgi:hypothetical protein